MRRTVLLPLLVLLLLSSTACCATRQEKLPRALFGATTMQARGSSCGQQLFVLGRRSGEHASYLATTAQAALSLLRAVRRAGPTCSQRIARARGSQASAQSSSGPGELGLLATDSGMVALVELRGRERLATLIAPMLPPAWVSVGNVAFLVDRLPSGAPIGFLLAQVPSGAVPLGSLGPVRTVRAPRLPVQRFPGLPLVIVGRPVPKASPGSLP